MNDAKVLAFPGRRIPEPYGLGISFQERPLLTSGRFTVTFVAPNVPVLDRGCVNAVCILSGPGFLSF